MNSRSTSGGKGDARRPGDRRRYASGWEAIYGRRKKQKGSPDILRKGGAHADRSKYDRKRKDDYETDY